jgi:hypothetical protein
MIGSVLYVVKPRSIERLHLGYGYKVPQSIRNKLSLVDGDIILASSRRIATPNDVINSLTKDDWRAVQDRPVPVNEKGKPYSPQRLATAQIKHPILMVYALSTNSPSGNPPVKIAPNTPLISVCIAYPKMSDQEFTTAAKKAKTYLVNTVWIRNYNGYVDDGDDSEDGDE